MGFGSCSVAAPLPSGLTARAGSRSYSLFSMAVATAHLEGYGLAGLHGVAMSSFALLPLKSLRRAACVVAVSLLCVAAASSRAQTPVPAVDGEPLARIRDAAMASDWAYRELGVLTDRVGPRLSGSPGAEAAVALLAGKMREAGASVSLQPCKVPHWVRGEERAALTDWPGHVGELRQRLQLTALGGSGATPAKGIEAAVLVVHDWDELQRRASEVPGRIVLFLNRFDQTLADNGHSGAAYGQAGEYRFAGPARAAELGAAAALVRSVGGADYRLPHTGATMFKDGQKPLPAAALSAEDADLIARLAVDGPVRMQLVLTPQTLPDVDSHNLIADLPGREHPEEVVIVSGHLDSWDLGTGAHDDGGPTMAALGVVELLKRMGLQPRRTIRAVAWMNEENGGRGATAYYDAVKDRIGTQIAAIESDAGAGRPYGISGAVDPASRAALAPLFSVLKPIGATVADWREPGEHVGSDIASLQSAGVPAFAPLVDNRHYFDYHHTAADTYDKIDPDAMRRQVAVMAVLAWALADAPTPLPRLPAAAH